MAKFEVWQGPEDTGHDTIEDGYAEAQEFGTFDAEAAAEEWGQRWDAEGDYIIIGGRWGSKGSPATVYVCPKGKPEERKTYTVQGELVAEYNAREVTDG